MSKQSSLTNFFARKAKPKLQRAITTPINAKKRKIDAVDIKEETNNNKPPAKRARLSLSGDESESPQKRAKKKRAPLQRSKTVGIHDKTPNDSPAKDKRLRPRSKPTKNDRSKSILVCEITLPNGTLLQLRKGDICNEDVGAIVNAANSYLAHGGGVAGAISRAAGRQLQKASDVWVRDHGCVATGTCAFTAAYDIPYTNWVIHAVGPIWRRGNETECDKELRSCSIASFTQAEALDLSSISIPAISSGIFGFPKPRCARIMFDAAIHFDANCKHDSLGTIRFTNFDSLTVGIFKKEFDIRFGASNDQNCDSDDESSDTVETKVHGDKDEVGEDEETS